MNDQTALIQSLQESRDRLLELVNSLSDEQLKVPYLPGINPPVWELGHSAFFFERFILQLLDRKAPYNPALDEIWDSFELAHEDRWTPNLFPNKADSLRYFDDIFQQVKARIQRNKLTDSDLYMYKYAISHLNMHLESMVWCRQSLGYSAPCATLASTPQNIDATPKSLSSDVEVPSGFYRIGMPANSTEYATTDFCFDNEKPGYTAEVATFRISSTLVTNAEFIEFIEAGGYANDALWRMAGLKWRNQQRAKHPIFWKKIDGVWHERHFDHWRPLVADHPVKHVCYWEAQAYCVHNNRRLPTETEWEAAALGNIEGLPFKKFPWGNSMDKSKVDMDCTHMASLSVNDLSEGDSPFGCRQMIGTLWEWTDSLFMPYDGFVKDIYPFMSTLQFGDHRVVRGGSCATASNLIRGTYRQAYTPDRNDVFAGFRTCAK